MLSCFLRKLGVAAAAAAMRGRITCQSARSAGLTADTMGAESIVRACVARGPARARPPCREEAIIVV
eukprot:CAMPEP_0182894834 /NCGR_PEP_ID=MMETSP0034_2-20130328/25320_1 /TAXON_ID=156128 /ORGANISM="Nephroselmis pyriformis, Strain CCMP717" /LENGTH=66 /DNA_ID=CAMNT_0025028637 /DNA_START=169 /DNA_END=365 /DNA_ORIENTATION=-